MRCWCGLFLAAGLMAQDAAPIGIVRGKVVAWETDGEGKMTILAAESQVYDCRFDDKNYFERDGQRIVAAGVHIGDPIEVVADRKAGQTKCYARTVHVVEQRPLRPLPGGRGRFGSSRGPTESFAPRGDLTFAGIVVGLDSDALVLRTRKDGQKTILLRPDTRYVGNGLTLDPASLRLNRPVFVRAGRNMDDQIEAYQVVWGEILEPR